MLGLQDCLQSRRSSPNSLVSRMQKKFVSVKVFAAAGLFFCVANPAHAQCGAGIPSGGNPNCLPPDVLYKNQGISQPQITAPAQQPIIIRQKWADRWGAMVLDDVNPVTGFSTGAESKSEALRLAKQDCLSRGGSVHEFVRISKPMCNNDC